MEKLKKASKKFGVRALIFFVLLLKPFIIQNQDFEFPSFIENRKYYNEISNSIWETAKSVWVIQAISKDRRVCSFTGVAIGKDKILSIAHYLKYLEDEQTIQYIGYNFKGERFELHLVKMSREKDLTLFELKNRKIRNTLEIKAPDLSYNLSFIVGYWGEARAGWVALLGISTYTKNKVIFAPKTAQGFSGAPIVSLPEKVCVGIVIGTLTEFTLGISADVILEFLKS